MKYDCLIVDDEALLSESTCEYFQMFDVKTAWIDSTHACLDFFKENEADLILLDINLGNESGFELCKHLRKTINAPILFISARTSDDDKLLALNIGGDDYISKPYSLAVLLAKVKTVLKRYQNTAVAVQANIYSAGGLDINFDTGVVLVNGNRVDFKAMEHKLLMYLVKNKNRVIPKEEIFKNVWMESFVGDNTLNVHVRYLREKIEDDPKNPKFIKTAWGTGYIFESAEA